jgi:hypothetical protein
MAFNFEHRRDVFMETGLPKSKQDFLNSRSEAAITLRKKSRYEALMNKRLKLTSSPTISTKSLDTLIQELDIHNLDSVKALRKALCNSQFDYAKLERFYPDIIDRLSPGLGGTHLEVTLEVAWCLTNIAGGSKGLVSNIAELIPRLAAYILNMENKIMAEQTCWVLGNLAAESKEIRDRIKEVCGLVKGITELLLLRTTSLSTVVCWTLCNLIRDHTPDASLFIEKGVLGIVLELTRRGCDKDECIESLWFLSYLSNNSGSPVYEQILMPENISAYLTILSTQHSSKILIPILRIIGNTLYYYEPAFSLINNSMLIDHLTKKLSSQEASVQRETAWIFSNIFSESISQVNLILQSPYAVQIISQLINLTSSHTQEVKNEAGIALYNLCERENSAYLMTVLNIGDIELLNFYLENIEYVPNWINYRLQDITDCDLLKVSIGFIQLILSYDTLCNIYVVPLALPEEIKLKANSRETCEVIEKCQMTFEGCDYRLSQNEELVRSMCRELIKEYFSEGGEFVFS